MVQKGMMRSALLSHIYKQIQDLQVVISNREKLQAWNGSYRNQECFVTGYSKSTQIFINIIHVMH